MSDLQCDDPCFEDSAQVQSFAVEFPDAFIGVDLVQTKPVKLVNGIFRTVGPARRPRDMEHDDCTPLWWTVEFWVHELETTELVAGVNAVVPPESTILDAGEHGTAGCQARISTEGDVVDVDVAHGMRLSLLTSHINVDVRCPNDPTTGQNTAAQIRAVDQPGVVVPAGPGPFFFWNTLIRAQLRPALAPVGQRVATFTISRSSTGVAPTRFVRIPARAIRMQVLENTALPAAPVPVTFLSHIGSAFVRGIVDFTTILDRRIYSVDIPGNSSIVDLGPTVRSVTIVFELEW